MNEQPFYYMPLAIIAFTYAVGIVIMAIILVKEWAERHRDWLEKRWLGPWRRRQAKKAVRTVRAATFGERLSYEKLLPIYGLLPFLAMSGCLTTVEYFGQDHLNWWGVGLTALIAWPMVRCWLRWRRWREWFYRGSNPRTRS